MRVYVRFFDDATKFSSGLRGAFLSTKVILNHLGQSHGSFGCHFRNFLNKLSSSTEK